MDEAELSADDAKERRIMKLLLKVKNGTPPQRKAALRHLTDKARELGAKPLLDAILPLLMQPTLEDQERHLLVKVIDRWVGVKCGAVGVVCVFQIVTVCDSGIAHGGVAGEVSVSRSFIARARW